MDQDQIIADIERRTALLPGLTIASLCREAEVHPTTFSRWKRSDRNPAPIGATIATLTKIEATLEQLEARAAGGHLHADADTAPALTQSAGNDTCASPRRAAHA